MRRAIFVGHSPPAGTGLALIHDGSDVGSEATATWIREHQPLLTLHGHIHESPVVSGRHTESIGRTNCHNPGQFAPDHVAVSMVTIEGDYVEIERILVDSRN